MQTKEGERKLLKKKEKKKKKKEKVKCYRSAEPLPMYSPLGAQATCQEGEQKKKKEKTEHFREPF